ncbi:MAG: glycosyltransferase family 4 protein [Thermoanaerobaculia bacterium]
MPRRIAQCIHGLGLGGAQKVVETLVTSLRNPDLEHFVYCSIDGPVRSRLEASGVRVRVIPRALPKFDPIWVGHLANAMESDQIDLVHTHLFGDSLHGYLAAQKAGELPVTMTLHSTHSFFSRLQRKGYRWLLPRCSEVVACSPSVGSSFVEAIPQLRDKMRVIPNGIHLELQATHSPDELHEFRRTLGLEAGTLVLLAMGRFVESKGYRDLIQAYSDLPAPVKARSQLLFLGQGPLERDLQKLSSSLNLSGRVIFGGYRQDVRRILSVCDVVVFSSLSEGLPIALLEAMAAERCIVATNIEGFRDVVAHESEALLARPADPQDLCAAIERALSDSSLRARLGDRARVRFSRHFTAEAMVESYARLYSDLLAGEQNPIRSRQHLH